MADRSTKPIAEVEVGDSVLATGPETGERGAREVTRLWVHEDAVVELQVGDDGHVVTTTDHPFWNATDQRWQRADQLDVGDQLLTADGTTVTVGGFVVGTDHTASAYNLTVDDIHTYYVSVGDADVLVHNTCRDNNTGTHVIADSKVHR